MTARVAGALALALLASSCAGPTVREETVVLLPGPDGRVGQVVVQRENSRQVLEQPYAANVVRGDGRLEGQQLTEQRVSENFGTTLAALPARATTFLLYFLTGKDELTPESTADLEKILADMKSRPVPDIVVTGHTDTVGSSDSNDRLSMQRADRVKQFLTGIGIPQDRIVVSGRGERELLVNTADNIDEPRNRRVEINVR
jgi:outer membrane protein OmpA-like peptidoglycan-associated protein